MNDRDESTDVWAEVIAAVEFLRDGLRPGLTVWEVLEEAVRRWLDGDQRAVSAWTDPDRLRSSVESLFRQLGPAGGYGACALSTVLTSALHGWIAEARRDHNEDKSFVGLERFADGRTAMRVSVEHRLPIPTDALSSSR